MTQTQPSLPEENRLIVFTRCPEPGRCKTRLIPALGTDGAVAIHKALVRRTMSWVRDAIDEGLVVEVRYAGDDVESLRLLCDDTADRIKFRAQHGDDLGQRLAEASATAFEEQVSKVVIVGTDCPQLTLHLATKAVSLLGRTDIVLGPAEDGGYYLIAIRKPCHQLFTGIVWGGSSVLSDTICRAAALQMSVVLLPVLADVDRVEDVRLLNPELVIE